MKNNENGRSMVEMLGVLAIIGVLSAGGLAGYSKAMFKHKLNTTMDQITMIVTNIRTMYGTQGNYSGFSEASAVDLGIVPAIMIASDATANETRTVSLTNPFKGDVNFALIDATTGTTASGDAATGFTLTYSGLPNEACIALSTADFGSGAGSGFIATKIDANAASGTYGTNSEGHAYAMSDAITHCNVAAKNDDHSITWSFY